MIGDGTSRCEVPRGGIGALKAAHSALAARRAGAEICTRAEVTA